jgi:glycine oxidase
MSEHTADVLIVGGGVIGLTTAAFLAERDIRVVLLDRADLGRQASWAGAGILPPGDPERSSTPAEQIRALGSASFPALSGQMRELTGIDNGFRVCGGIELSHEDFLPTDEWAGPGAVAVRPDRAGIELEPSLAEHITSACYLPDLAQVRNPRHLQALIRMCEMRNVRLIPNTSVDAIIRRGERVVRVETATGSFIAGQYLLATGAWTDELTRDLGWRPDIRPVRGQIALLNTGVTGVRPVLMQGKRYLVPRDDGRILIGSTEERVGFDPRPTAAGVAGLLSFAVELMPSLRDATMERCWAGLRPGSPDGQPFLGRVPGFDNLFVAAGHFRAGIQLSPITARLMTQLLTGHPTEMPLEAFRPDRTARIPIEGEVQ